MRVRPRYQDLAYTLGGVLIFYTVVVILLMSIEVGSPASHMDGLQDVVWYIMATITTVGYGDIVPVTEWGRNIGFIVLLSSLGVYGFIIGQIANFMSTLKEEKELGLNGTTFKNHVVIIGWNDFGQSVVTTLTAAGRLVAIVTKDRGSIDIIHEFYDSKKVYTLYSDYNNFDLIEKANIKEASVVFVNLNDDTEKLVYVINLKKRFADLNYVVTLDNGNLKSTFQNAGVTYAISKNEISSKLLASYIYEPDVALFSEELIAYAHEDHEYDMKQLLVNRDNPYAEVPYEKAFFDLKKSSNVVLIGLVKIKNGTRTLLKNPEGSVKIEVGDYLVVMLDGNGEKRLRKQFEMQEGISLI